MKRVLSIVFTLTLLLSMVTTALEVSAASTTVNGKEAEVGAIVTYSVDLTTPEALEDYQGTITYNSKGLALKTLVAEDNGFMSNAEVDGSGNFSKFTNSDAISSDGTASLEYSASSLTDLDYTTTHSVVTLTFEVLTEGTWTVKNSWYAMTGWSKTDEGTIYYNKGKEVKSGTKTEEVTSTEEIDPTKATVNGKDVNVGDTVTYTYNLKTSSKIEDLEGNVVYSNKGLALQSFEPIYTEGVIYNENKKLADGSTGIHYNFASAENPLDCSNGADLFKATFKVTTAGKWSLKYRVEVMDAQGSDYTPIALVEDGQTTGKEVFNDTADGKNIVINGGDQPVSSSTQKTSSEKTSSSTKSEVTTAIVNGQTYNVGDTVKYTYKITSTEYPLEDIQGDLIYTKGLTLKEFTPIITSGVDYNANDTEDPRAPLVHYTMASATKPYDAKNGLDLFEAEFTVTAAGTQTINFELQFADGQNDSKDSVELVAGGKVVADTFSSEETVKPGTIQSQTNPTNSQPTQTNSKPTTTEPTPTVTTPADEYATVNGTRYLVGSLVRYVYNLKSPLKVEDIQGNIEYSNAGLELTNFVSYLDSGVIYNTDYTLEDGSKAIHYNFFSTVNPYDCTNGIDFFAAEFKVTKAGTWTIDFNVEIMDGQDDKGNAVPFVTDGKDEPTANYTADKILQLVSEPETKPTQTQSKPTETQSKPTETQSKPTETQSKPTETTPADKYATVNGTRYLVGTVVSYTYNLKSPVKIEDMQGNLIYSNEGLELKNFESHQTAGVIYNTDFPLDDGSKAVHYDFFSTVTPYDCTNGLDFFTAQFLVAKEGTWTIKFDLEILDGQDENKQSVPMVTDGEDEPTANYEASGNVKVVSEPETKPTETQTQSKPTETQTQSKPTETQTQSKPTETQTQSKPTETQTQSKPTETQTQSKPTETQTQSKPTETQTQSKPTETQTQSKPTETQTQSKPTETQTQSKPTETQTQSKPTETQTQSKPTETTQTPVKNYNVKTQFSNVTSSNTATTVKEGTPYVTVLKAQSGYEITTVLAVMGGEILNTTKNSDGSYTVTVARATGDITIQAVATKVTQPTQTQSQTQSKPTETQTTPTATKPVEYKVSTMISPANTVVNTNTAATVTKGSSYSTIITPVEGYQIVQVLATMGTKDIAPIKSGESYIINVGSADADISVIVVTEKKPEPTTPTATETKPTQTSNSESQPTVSKPTETKPTETTKPAPVDFLVSNMLVNVNTDNSASTVTEGKSYKEVLTTVDGYKIDSVKVMMGNDVITAVKSGDSYVIDIAKVTGNISVIAAASKIETPTQSKPTETTPTAAPAKEYVVSAQLVNVTSTNGSIEKVKEGNAYSTVLMAAEGYKIDVVMVTMGGKAVETVTAGTNAIVNIANVTGDISIIATASKIEIPTETKATESKPTETKPTVTETKPTETQPKPEVYYEVSTMFNGEINALNKDTKVKEGDSYQTILVAADGYAIDMVKVVMGNSEIPATITGSNAVININAVTGNISIMAIAQKVVEPSTPQQPTSATQPVAKDFSVYATAYHANFTNNVTSVKEGSSFTTVITPDNGYAISSVTAYMGSNVIAPVKVGDSYTISIDKVTDNIVITAVADPIPTQTVPTETKPVVEIEYIVSNMLDNVTCSNSNIKVKEGAPYAATYSPTSGYEIKSFMAVMAGVPISAVKSGDNYIINLSAVTGNITVTAIAEKKTTPTQTETKATETETKATETETKATETETKATETETKATETTPTQTETKATQPATKATTVQPTTVKVATPVSPGANIKDAEKSITSSKTEEPKGATFGKLLARQGKVTNKSIQIKWKKVSGAKKYILYANQCGSKYKYKKLKVLSSAKSSVNLAKIAGKKIKKGTYYKFLLVAVNSKNQVISTGCTLHIATTGGKVGNSKGVTTAAKKDKVTLAKKGKTFNLKAKAVAASKKLTVKKHRNIKFESSNKKIATVSSKGVIKAVKKGTCYIYVYAQNGMYKKIKVTVKK